MNRNMTNQSINQSKATVYFGCGRSTSVKTEVRTALTGGNAPPMTLVERISLNPAWKFSELHAKRQTTHKRTERNENSPTIIVRGHGEAGKYAINGAEVRMIQVVAESGNGPKLRGRVTILSALSAGIVVVVGVAAELIHRLQLASLPDISSRKLKPTSPKNKKFQAPTPVFSRIRTGP